MDKEAIRLLIKALKKKPEEQPINTQGLPELPTLQMDQQPVRVETSTVEPHITQDQGLSVGLNGVHYQNDMGNVHLNHKGLSLDSPYVRGHMGLDKGYNVSGTIPLNDGRITASYASDPDEGRNFRLQLAKKLMGGDLSVGMSNAAGDKSYNMQYKKEF
jgi:hypothetical protein